MSNLKKAMLIAHDNTHSTSRILRNVKLIKEEVDAATIEKILKVIEEASIECRNQVDELCYEKC
jgi:hypothetical protein